MENHISPRTGVVGIVQRIRISNKSINRIAVHQLLNILRVLLSLSIFQKI